MSYPFGFHTHIAGAEYSAAYDNLQHDFALFHATVIAPLEANVRVGAISLLAAAGTRIDGTPLHAALGNRHMYSTGFLLTGDIEGAGASRMAPVVKIDARFNGKEKEYERVMQKSFQRDRRLSIAQVAMRNVGHITTLLQEVPISITAGTICNRPNDTEQWVPFTQTTARRVRPISQHGTLVPAGYVRRRVFGDVLSGHFRPDHTFKGPNTQRLESLPLSTLPSLRVNPEEVVALTNNPDMHAETLLGHLTTAVHNEQMATGLFQAVKSCATSLAHGKLGRHFWYGDSSAAHKFKQPVNISKLLPD